MLAGQVSWPAKVKEPVKTTLLLKDQEMDLTGQAVRHMAGSKRKTIPIANT